MGEDFVLLVRSRGEVVATNGRGGEDLGGEGEIILRPAVSLEEEEEVFTDRSMGSSCSTEPLLGLGVEAMLGEKPGVVE